MVVLVHSLSILRMHSSYSRVTSELSCCALSDHQIAVPVAPLMIVFKALRDTLHFFFWSFWQKSIQKMKKPTSTVGSSGNGFIMQLMKRFQLNGSDDTHWDPTTTPNWILIVQRCQVTGEWFLEDARKLVFALWESLCAKEIQNKMAPRHVSFLTTSLIDHRFLVVIFLNRRQHFLTEPTVFWRILIDFIGKKGDKSGRKWYSGLLVLHLGFEPPLQSNWLLTFVIIFFSRLHCLFVRNSTSTFPLGTGIMLNAWSAVLFDKMRKKTYF